MGLEILHCSRLFGEHLASRRLLGEHLAGSQVMQMGTPSSRALV